MPMLEFLASITNRWRRQRRVGAHETFAEWRPARPVRVVGQGPRLQNCKFINAPGTSRAFCVPAQSRPDLGDGLNLDGYSPAERALFAHKTFNGG